MKAALVAALDAALTVPVFWCWQPDVQADCAFLGRAIVDELTHDEIVITYEFPTAELNRPCTESYTVPVSVWSWRGDLTPDKAQTAEVELYENIDLILAALNDVDLGTGISLNARPTRMPVERRENNAGWVVWAIVDVEVSATLT